MKNSLNFFCIFFATFFTFSQNFGMQSPNFGIEKDKKQTLVPFTILPPENSGEEQLEIQKSTFPTTIDSTSTSTFTIPDQTRTAVQQQEQIALKYQDIYYSPSTSSNSPIEISINYSLLPKINALFNGNSTNEVKEKNAALENWLDDIPHGFHQTVIKEIISATEKYLSKSLNTEVSFFNALPNNSLIKTILCFLYNLDYPCANSMLKKTIENFTNSYHLHEIFKTINYCINETPRTLSLINFLSKESDEKKFILKQLQKIFPNVTNLKGIYINKFDKDQFDEAFNIHTIERRHVDVKTMYKFLGIIEIPLLKRLNLETNKYLARLRNQKRQTLNNILKITESYFNTTVTSLNLSLNLLDSIPDAVYYMPNLQELILHENRIMVVLKNIKNLRQLKVLDLQNNRLEALPKELLILHKLEKVDLRGNPGLKYHSQSQEIIKALIAKGVNVKYDNN